MQAVIAATVPTGVSNSVKNSSLSIDPSIYARIDANEIFHDVSLLFFTAQSAKGMHQSGSIDITLISRSIFGIIALSQ